MKEEKLIAFLESHKIWVQDNYTSDLTYTVFTV